MIPIYENPRRDAWAALQRRVANDEADIAARVEAILARVEAGGDRALRELSAEIDGYGPEELQVPADEMRAAAEAVSPEVREAMEAAAEHIRRFHEAQRPAEVALETAPGVRCVQRAVPIERVGLYIPGGRAPLFSTVLMLGVPAAVAGCPDVILCTPPDRSGRVAPEILYAARLCGIERVYRVGGAQAVAAMAYGTETIGRRDKILGPGNRYVTRAKQIVGLTACAIDMPAGPSEVLVMADREADPAFLAADLLSQAEHGDDSQAVLLCLSAEQARAAAGEAERQTARLERRETIRRALAHSRIVVLADEEEMVDFANGYAAEHLIIAMREGWRVAGRIRAAGSVFVGYWSPESAGDYASGTNHTLPTSGWARAFSGVNFDSFVRKITYQELTPAGLEGLGRTIRTMAGAEGLDAHAEAVAVRLRQLQTGKEETR